MSPSRSRLRPCTDSPIYLLHKARRDAWRQAGGDPARFAEIMLEYLRGRDEQGLGNASELAYSGARWTWYVADAKRPPE